MKRIKRHPDVQMVDWTPPADLPEARRLAPEFPEKWSAAGQFIWNGEREIGTMKTPRLAQLVCVCHNCFLWLLNRVLWLGKRLEDVEGTGHE